MSRERQSTNKKQFDKVLVEESNENRELKISPSELIKFQDFLRMYGSTYDHFVPGVSYHLW